MTLPLVASAAALNWTVSPAIPLTKYANGQVISECKFDVLNFPKNQREKFDEFLPYNLEIGYIGEIMVFLFTNCVK